LDKKDKKILVN